MSFPIECIDPILPKAQGIQVQRDPLSLSYQVYHAIMTEFDGQKPELAMIANQLGVSSRSLRRHLQSEGARFSSIMQQVMVDLSKKKLADSDSIQCVAYDMGFSEPSAFSRAFRRWTQQTPKEYRMKMQSQ